MTPNPEYFKELLESEYLIIGTETSTMGFSLKEGAPDHIKKLFDEFMKLEDEHIIAVD